MEVNLLILVIIAAIFIFIAIITIFSLIMPGRFSQMAKEICLLTIAKIFGNPKVCEVFRV